MVMAFGRRRAAAGSLRRRLRDPQLGRDRLDQVRDLLGSSGRSAGEHPVGAQQLGSRRAGAEAAPERAARVSEDQVCAGVRRLLGDDVDPDRREELARLCLKDLGLRPAGESLAQAQDRLNTLSSVERQRVIGAARQAEERTRAIRAEMARKARAEADSKAMRE